MKDKIAADYKSNPRGFNSIFFLMAGWAVMLMFRDEVWAWAMAAFHDTNKTIVVIILIPMLLMLVGDVLIAGRQRVTGKPVLWIGIIAAFAYLFFK